MCVRAERGESRARQRQVIFYHNIPVGIITIHKCFVYSTCNETIFFTSVERIYSGSIPAATTMSAEPQSKKAKMTSLDQLKTFTTIVADTGDFEGKNIALNIKDRLFIIAKRIQPQALVRNQNQQIIAYSEGDPGRFNFRVPCVLLSRFDQVPVELDFAKFCCVVFWTKWLIAKWCSGLVKLLCPLQAVSVTHGCDYGLFKFHGNMMISFVLQLWRPTSRPMPPPIRR